MSRLLQLLGIAFVLLLVGAATAGFAVLKDRVRVVVSADDVEQGPDAVALLRDDVRVLAEDTAALQALLRSGLEQLAAALQQSAALDAERALSVTPRLGEIEQRLTQLAQRLGGTEQLLQALERRFASGGEPQHQLAVAAPPVAATEAGSVEVAQPSATEPAAPAPPADPALPAASAAAAPKTGFLSFSLPAAQFTFDAPQNYELLPELSRVGFDAKSTLHDFTGVTSAVRGSFRGEFAHAGELSGDVVVTAATLRTGVDGRDDNLRVHLATDAHPEIRFALSRFEPAADGVDVAARRARGNVHGTMSIRGVSRPVVMPVEVEVDAQRRLEVRGQMPLLLSDYGVPVPSQLGVINMQDEVQVWVALRARVRTEAKR